MKPQPQFNWRLDKEHPCWIENVVSITALPEEIAEFKELVGGPTYRVYNNLIFEKDQPKVALKFLYRDMPFSFHRIQPMPYDIQITRNITPANEKEEMEMIMLAGKYEYSHWYEWAMENWGTKWDARWGAIDHIDESNINFSFYTYEDPPLAIFDELSVYCDLHDIQMDWLYGKEDYGYQWLD